MYIMTKFDTQSINKISIDRYHVIIDKAKILDLYHNDDLRFFKKQKQMICDISKQSSGIILKVSSWDYPYLKHDYLMSNRIKHKNFVKHHCYFEYEEDILAYLSNSSEDKYEHSAVVISSYHIPFNKFDFNTIDKENYYNVIRQIILALYHAYFNCHVQFNDILLDNIFVDYQTNKEKIKYNIGQQQYTIETNYVVKIDAFIHSELILDLFPYHYKRLYGNIENILQTLPVIFDISKIIDIVHDFNSNSDHVVHPLKILHNILATIETSYRSYK